MILWREKKKETVMLAQKLLRACVTLLKENLLLNLLFIYCYKYISLPGKEKKS